MNALRLVSTTYIVYTELQISSSAGVRLYLGYGSALPMNYVLLASSQVRNGDSQDDGLDSYDDGLWCQSAIDTTNNIGSWSYPTSEGYGVVNTNEADPLPFYTKPAIGQVGLSVESSVQGYSGYYQCEIPDENNIIQYQYAVLYPPGLYSSYGKGADRTVSQLFLSVQLVQLLSPLCSSLCYLQRMQLNQDSVCPLTCLMVHPQSSTALWMEVT